ncbi:MAG: hydroxymethylbilane synthase [Myxococcota bacterium]
MIGSRAIRIGTRGSALALWQANRVRALLEACGHAVTLATIATTGDRIQTRPLAAVGGKGLFLKEIEDALLAGTIDVAVHSLKDVPAELPRGLALAAMLEREDPRDALVSRDRVPLADLGSGARIGTTSLRRACQLRARRPDLRVEPLRGNVDTRLRKVQRGDVDAAVLALAGLRRLGLESEVAEIFSLEDSLPAIGQGTIAIETRSADATLCAPLDHAPTSTCARAERAVLAALGGDCFVPIAAHARLDGARDLRLDGLIGAPDGSRLARASTDGPADRPEEAGRALADRLLAAGGREILAALRAL